MNKVLKSIFSILCVLAIATAVFAGTNSEIRNKIVDTLSGKIKIDEEKFIELEDKGYDIDDIAVAAQFGNKYNLDEELILEEMEGGKSHQRLSQEYQEVEQKKYYISGSDALNLVNEGYSFTELRQLQAYMLFSKSDLEKALIDKGSKTTSKLLDDYHNANKSDVEILHTTDNNLNEVILTEIRLLPVETWMIDLFNEGYGVFEIVQIKNYSITYEYVKSGITLEQVIAIYKEVRSGVLLKDELEKLKDPNVGAFDPSSEN